VAAADAKLSSEAVFIGTIHWDCTSHILFPGSRTMVGERWKLPLKCQLILPVDLPHLTLSAIEQSSLKMKDSAADLIVISIAL
jgi:hypothetical protein